MVSQLAHRAGQQLEMATSNLNSLSQEAPDNRVHHLLLLRVEPQGVRQELKVVVAERHPQRMARIKLAEHPVFGMDGRRQVEDARRRHEQPPHEARAAWHLARHVRLTKLCKQRWQGSGESHNAVVFEGRSDPEQRFLKSAFVAGGKQLEVSHDRVELLTLQQHQLHRNLVAPLEQRVEGVAAGKPEPGHKARTKLLPQSVRLCADALSRHTRELKPGPSALAAQTAHGAPRIVAVREAQLHDKAATDVSTLQDRRTRTADLERSLEVHLVHRCLPVDTRRRVDVSRRLVEQGKSVHVQEDICRPADGVANDHSEDVAVMHAELIEARIGRTTAALQENLKDPFVVLEGAVYGVAVSGELARDGVPFGKEGQVRKRAEGNRAHLDICFHGKPAEPEPVPAVRLQPLQLPRQPVDRSDVTSAPLPSNVRAQRLELNRVHR